MRRLLLILPLLSFLVALGAASPPSGAAAHEDGVPTVQELIRIVRGHDVATVRRTFPAYNTGLFERVFGAGTPIPVSSDHDRSLFETQLVRTPAGVVLDVGHVVTGLEAAAPLPATARQVEMLTGCTMRAAVTWSGDVGEALALFVLSGEADPSSFFERSASVEDLYGDLDGYALGAAFGGPAIDVADVLARAYLDGDHEAHRFARFWEALGGDPEAVIAREIGCFAAAYGALTGRSLDRARLAEAASYFVHRFCTFVWDGLATEAAGTN
jgi:hypothetical protein